MIRMKSDFARLEAELGADMEDLGRCLEKNRRAMQRVEHGACDDLDYAALGYTIHALYGVIENYCFRIAKFFENSVDPSSWHRELLQRMGLTILGVRPALFDKPTLLLLDELRAFRHLFRNLYARDFDPPRLLAVQAKVEPACEAFSGAHRNFVDMLQKIAASL
jgi:hypothetical protein